MRGVVSAECRPRLQSLAGNSPPAALWRPRIEAVYALLDGLKPDLLVLLNGRFFGRRVAVELAVVRGLCFVTHGRGSSKDGLMFRDGRLCFMRALDCPESCDEARENLAQVYAAATPLEVALSAPTAWCR